MSLNLSKDEACTATDERLAYVKNGTRSDSAPHQIATDEIAYRHRKRLLRLGLYYAVATAMLVGVIWVGTRLLV